MKSEIMDCEKYLSKLYKESKFCNCENLVRFAYLDEKKKNLRNLCWDLSESLNDIHKGNFEVSELYEKKLYEFVNFSNEHNLELNLLIKNNKLKLYYHNEKNNYH
ncbi:MAG: hypothetical protein Q8Q86_03740, partial [Candidatus Daviesbacteria bacterium]|nr:hypothetical protein [Candidatus Daviesbacteria bacterium]